jgi:hypothetical protein
MRNKKPQPAGFSGHFYLLCAMKIRCVVSDREYSVFSLEGPGVNDDYSFRESFQTHNYTAWTNLLDF